MRRTLTLVMLLLTALLVPSPAHAGTLPPVVELERAWVVGKGAAVEVAYTVTCPDPADQVYRHAMWTNHEYLEFRCGPEPRRIVQLLPGPARKSDALTVTTRVVSPQCMYFDFSGLEPGELGCWVVDQTETVQLRSSSFLPESATDVGGHVDVTDVQPTSDGSLEITAAFSCTQALTAGVGYTVGEMTKDGYTEAYGGGAEPIVSCEPGTDTSTTLLVTPTDPQRPFVPGDVVVALNWVENYEGGPWGFYTGLHQIRR